MSRPDSFSDLVNGLFCIHLKTFAQLQCNVLSGMCKKKVKTLIFI